MFGSFGSGILTLLCTTRSRPHRAYNVVFGLFQAPYYAFSQTMMAELTPPGFDNMVRCQCRCITSTIFIPYPSPQFFGLFGLSNRASSTIGPTVIQAIIDRSGNNWMGFPFLFALCFSASMVIWFGIDVTKGRRDAVAWADAVRADAKDYSETRPSEEQLL
jgi:MFS-type transporter involved in bile tolerance (Atg22 family)